MTPADLTAARKRLGLSQAGLSQALRMGKHGGRTVRRWELGEIEVPGPVAVAVELMLREKAQGPRSFDVRDRTAHRQRSPRHEG